MTSKLLLLICILIAFPVLMILIALLKNDLPWSDPPGFGTRLATYLNTNIAETTIDSVFPELIPRRYALDKDVLKKLIVESMEKLGWDIVEPFDQHNKLHALVATPLLGFKDDVHIKLEPGAGGTVLVSVRSASRTGKGDLGTNTRHILDLFETLDSVITLAAKQ